MRRKPHMGAAGGIPRFSLSHFRGRETGGSGAHVAFSRGFCRSTPPEPVPRGFVLKKWESGNLRKTALLLPLFRRRVLHYAGYRPQPPHRTQTPATAHDPLHPTTNPKARYRRRPRIGVTGGYGGWLLSRRCIGVLASRIGRWERWRTRTDSGVLRRSASRTCP